MDNKAMKTPHPAFSATPIPTVEEVANQKPRASPLTKKRKWADLETYEEVLNLARNTLGKTEDELLSAAGYSNGTVATKWRASGQFPLLAVNAIRGLLMGHSLALMDKADGRQPLKLRTEDIETLCGALRLMEQNPNARKLRAGLYKELARRLES